MMVIQAGGEGERYDFSFNEIALAGYEKRHPQVPFRDARYHRSEGRLYYLRVNSG